MSGMTVAWHFSDIDQVNDHAPGPLAPERAENFWCEPVLSDIPPLEALPVAC